MSKPRLAYSVMGHIVAAVRHAIQDSSCACVNLRHRCFHCELVEIDEYLTDPKNWTGIDDLMGPIGEVKEKEVSA